MVVGIVVYLLHFSRPFWHARHYVGFVDSADGLQRRLEDHARGQGARIVAAARAVGITFVLARVWPDGDRGFERRIKRRKMTPRYCPICRAKARRQQDVASEVEA